ncbi:uncharacterized protein N7515_000112 [Penicillium bovifimosum]|uniref:Transcription initiation factor TFIID subunit 13 n=1 Tax=Penicillium bovifimosum TaxID=126998 RepID=A0A9W9HEU0_9EURO|nr:uncharacterized protein N7515_000112 [Penicillium bovifimosum]KAJ5145548.1 hypothetical protein N7515_000112 [Penicillium bovifimosum]
MSAERTDLPPEQVSFCLPNEEIASPTCSPTCSPPSNPTQTIDPRPGVPYKTLPPPAPEPQPSNSSPTPGPSSPTPSLISKSDSTSTDEDNEDEDKSNKPKMAEPRARMARHKGQMNFQNELRLLLLAYGDPSPHPSFPTEPLPETVRVLDEIITDFVLELCHGAGQVAHHARRQKIKVEDFRFALRRDPNKLGRVQELLRMERELKEARKAFDQNDDQVAKEAGKKGAAAAAAAAAAAGEDPEAAEAAAAAAHTKKSKGKGKKANRRGSDATEESVSKKRKTG